MKQPAYVSRQPDVVFPGDDAIGPSAQIQHQEQQDESTERSHNTPLEHPPRGQTRLPWISGAFCRKSAGSPVCPRGSVHAILKGVDPVSGVLNPQQIAVLGLGYVGCVTAACLAQVGHRVVGVDRDQFKVDNVRAGRAPFFEPGLEELVSDGVVSGRLTASVSLHDALAGADVALICVGTPSEKNGNLGLDQLRRVSQEIAESLPGRIKPLVVAVRSTVYPGTCEDVVLPQMGGSPLVSVVSNPEFLREGVAVRDFMEPSLLVVGGSSPAAAQPG